MMVLYQGGCYDGFESGFYGRLPLIFSSRRCRRHLLELGERVSQKAKNYMGNSEMVKRGRRVRKGRKRGKIERRVVSLPYVLHL